MSLKCRSDISLCCCNVSATAVTAWLASLSVVADVSNIFTILLADYGPGVKIFFVCFSLVLLLVASLALVAVWTRNHKPLIPFLTLIIFATCMVATFCFFYLLVNVALIIFTGRQPQARDDKHWPTITVNLSLLLVIPVLVWCCVAVCRCFCAFLSGSPPSVELEEVEGTNPAQIMDG
uniref:MARVEL domain-containing protein n=1 Tax=Steinernema glaseri TaxID=37863 RepID=A0A1I8A2H5_9BILA